MDRAHFRIRAERPDDETTVSAAGGAARSEREAQFAELTGHGFLASLVLASAIALAALFGAFDGVATHNRAASMALLAAAIFAGVHTKKCLNAAAFESGWALHRHRALLLVFGLCCALASQAWAQTSAAATTACASVLMLIGGLGASSAAADRTSLMLWIGTTLALPITLSFATPSEEERDKEWLLVIFFIVVLGLAASVRRLIMRARRVREENDRLVAQLRHHVSLVEAADKEKTRFLGAASHDLRQPMHALGLFAAALEKQLRGDARHANVINMTRAVDALGDSFSAMLDVSKLDAGIVEPNVQTFPIRDVFRRLHMHGAGQAEAKGLSLRFKAGAKLVTSDPQLLERILGNMVQNAIRYTHTGGVIVVARTRRDRLSLEVWDTGVGISREQLPHIFKEFYQVKNQGRDRSKGLGMGLSIVKRLVLLLNYELEVESVLGRGTVFRVLLPLTQLEEMPNLVLGADTIPSPQDEGRTLLVIDDEDAVRAGMNELLQGWGFTVLLAGTIEEARAAVLHHNGLIDCVVSDLRLANGEDGLWAIEEVQRAYGAPLPAILVTGDTSPEEVMRADAGGHPVLFKPVRPRDLFAALRHTS